MLKSCSSKSEGEKAKRQENTGSEYGGPSIPVVQHVQIQPVLDPRLVESQDAVTTDGEGQLYHAILCKGIERLQLWHPWEPWN